ncbi:MAG: alpha/beta hydrolase [Rhodospirillum sp.]|nr:alpha/beta hydrolase [Rhodospirillum sp.]MCF8491016.1 alpha/beta hydrolase [Rhodospirillum sp.]MCF8502487.1 alpha/beta hydrolase [Rhodospirillum sp.]
MSATLLFLPGLLSDAVVWKVILEDLTAPLPTVIGDLTTQDSIAAMAQDMLDRHPGPLAVVGHSMGGRVALEMARQAPDRIVGLALLDTGIHPAKPGEEGLRHALTALGQEKGMPAVAEAWLPPMVHPGRHKDGDLMGVLTKMVARMNPEIHARQIQALLTRPDAAPVLPTLTCPVMLIVGQQDSWSPPEHHAEMAEAIPGATLEIVENAGHFAPIERPEAVHAILERWAAGLGV